MERGRRHAYDSAARPDPPEEFAPNQYGHAFHTRQLWRSATGSIEARGLRTVVRSSMIAY